MSRRILLEDEAPVDLETLLQEIACLMCRKDGNRKFWQARAHDCSEFSRGDTPSESMTRAIALRVMKQRNKKAVQ